MMTNSQEPRNPMQWVEKTVAIARVTITRQDNGYFSVIFGSPFSFMNGEFELIYNNLEDALAQSVNLLRDGQQVSFPIASSSKGKT